MTQFFRGEIDALYGKPVHDQQGIVIQQPQVDRSCFLPVNTVDLPAAICFEDGYLLSIKRLHRQEPCRRTQRHAQENVVGLRLRDDPDFLATAHEGPGEKEQGGKCFHEGGFRRKDNKNRGRKFRMTSESNPLYSLRLSVCPLWLSVGKKNTIPQRATEKSQRATEIEL